MVSSFLALVVSMLCLCIDSGSVNTDAVLPNRLGKFNFEELEKSIYRVVLATNPVVEEEENEGEKEPQKELESDKTADIPSAVTVTKSGEAMSLTTSRGQKFSCLVPQQPSDSSRNKSELVTFPNVTDILLTLSGRPCLTKTVGWWTYEYCHGKFVRQYHVEAGVLVGQSFYLGFYSNETVWTEDKVKLVKESQGKLRSGEANMHAYHSVLHVNGTECDMTKTPRSTEVKLTCGLTGLDSLVDVQELDTCHYLLQVHTSLLCDVPYFKREQLEDVLVITCSPVVSAENYQAYLEEQKRQAALEAKGDDDREKKQGEVKQHGDTSSEKEKPLTAGTAKAERPEDLAMEVIGDRDERTVLLYRLGRAMGISLQGDKEGEEELDLLRHKFRALSSYHLRLLLAKLEQEIRRDDEETTMRTEEKETESMLEGVVKAEGDEEKELAGELEMDEESLGSLEEAVTSEVKEKLAELGLPTDGLEVKLKVASIELDEDENEEGGEETGVEQEPEGDGGNGGEVATKKDKKKREVKVIKLTLLTDALGKSESHRRRKEREAKEKDKMSYLEQAYNLVWENKQDQAKKRKQDQS